MGRFNWGIEGAPGEAYSRVTEPERFRPLHEWALESVARLQSEYEISLDEGEGIDAGLERVPLSRPTLKLTPLQDSCAPITIAFTDFPGLGVRVGHCVIEWFPSCGCDACDEMPDDEFERFTELLSDVVAGRFRESLDLGLAGDGRSSMELWSGNHRRRSRGSRVPRDAASRILNGKKKIALEWTPWHTKSHDTATRQPQI